MAETDIFIVPQDQTLNESKVVVTDFQKRRGYTFDAVIRYRTRRTYKVTRHSVPAGAAITDHVSKNPIEFQLVGFLTPYNVVSLAGSGTAFASAAGGVTSLSRVLERGAATALELARRNRDQLVQLADNFTLLTVMGDEFQHANMMITSVDDPKTVALGDSYQLTVSFKQIRIPRSSSKVDPIVSDDAMKAGFRPLKEIAGR